MPGRTIAIGDIHGCDAALAAIVDAVEPTPSDTIITLGDYIDRGPASRQVIDRLIALGQRCELITLLGNHEVMMLRALEKTIGASESWLRCGGRQALASYGGSLDNVPFEHIEFLNNLLDYHETPQHIFVHANYYHDSEMDEQPQYHSIWQHLDEPMIPPPHMSGKTVFVGHTPQLTGEVLDLGHVVCIDTACVMGGWLTAIDVNTRQVWQADRDGRPRA
jgi:serine/threonine protein phosphatase 1